MRGCEEVMWLPGFFVLGWAGGHQGEGMMTRCRGDTEGRRGHSVKLYNKLYVASEITFWKSVVLINVMFCVKPQVANKQISITAVHWAWQLADSTITIICGHVKSKKLKFWRIMLILLWQYRIAETFHSCDDILLQTQAGDFIHLTMFQHCLTHNLHYIHHRPIHLSSSQLTKFLTWRRLHHEDVTIVCSSTCYQVIMASCWEQTSEWWR